MPLASGSIAEKFYHYCSSSALDCFSRLCANVSFIVIGPVVLSYVFSPTTHNLAHTFDRKNTARSDNTTLQSFKEFDYKKGLGPGLYDIHSPVVPPVATLQEKLEGKSNDRIYGTPYLFIYDYISY